MKIHKRSRSQFLQQNRSRKSGGFWLPLVFAVLAIAFVSLIATYSKPGNAVHAAPFSPACEPHGYLFQYENRNPPNSPPTSVNSVDLITNTLNLAGTIAGRTVNAVGYNVHDNFMYGWDNTTPRTFVRIHGDLTNADPLTVSGLPGGIGIVYAGDVDNNRQYWFADGTTWYRIDLSSGTPTYQNSATIHGAGPPTTLPTSTSTVLDLAFVPPTILNDNRGGLYTVVVDNNDNQTKLYRFDISNPGSPAWELIGSLAADMTEADGEVGALYADALGGLYASTNEDSIGNGPLWRIVIGNQSLSTPIPLKAFKVASGPAAHGNDGARCANAYPPADFGDAPLSYNTRWEDFGPLHAVGNFDDENSEAPLMLGKKVDIEGIASDSFPDAAADGDDKDHTSTSPFVNDEDGAQHIVASPGAPTALAVPVTITNNSSNPATLAGWVDLDNSGTFDAGERVTQDIPANSGQSVYELTFPQTTFSGNTYARFRLFQGTGLDNSQLQPSGLESAFLIGEVEDYLVQVGSFEVKKTVDPPTGSEVSPGDTLAYTLDITNTETADLSNLRVHDDLSDVLDDATMEGDPMVSPSSAGSATVTGNTLEFSGDVPAGQTVTVTYSVKVNNPDSLGNHEIRNHVIAAHSNCHPIVGGGQQTTDNPDCQTTHPVLGLANTGGSIVLPLALSGGLLASGVSAWIITKKQRSILRALGHR